MKSYQKRLRALLLEARRDGETLRQLASRMGNERLKSRLWCWLNNELRQQLRGDSFHRLAMIDPHGRSPEEIKAWFLEPETKPDPIFNLLLCRFLVGDQPEKTIA